MIELCCHNINWPDWIQAIAALIGVFFLIGNFLELQKQSKDSDRKINIIESSFAAQFVKAKLSSTQSTFNLKLENIGNDAININLNDVESNKYLGYNVRVKKNETLDLGSIQKRESEFNLPTNPHVLIISFSSSLGINYQQKIELMDYNDFSLVKISSPVKV